MPVERYKQNNATTASLSLNPFLQRKHFVRYQFIEWFKIKNPSVLRRDLQIGLIIFTGPVLKM